MKEIIMCPSCKAMLVDAGYQVKEVGSTDKREKCFWCVNRGYFSAYSTERRKKGAKSLSGKK